MNKQLFRLILLGIFLILIGYIFYQIPQIILQDLNWPQAIKLSTVTCGIILGILFFTKEKLPDEKIETIKKSGEEEEEEEKVTVNSTKETKTPTTEKIIKNDDGVTDKPAGGTKTDTKHSHQEMHTPTTALTNKES